VSILSGMTGFARTEGVEGDWRWSWEARSVNGKGLDIRLRFPPGFDRLEARARELGKARFVRGNIQASLVLKRDTGPSGLGVDTGRIDALLEAARPYVERGQVQAPTFEAMAALAASLGNDEPATDDTGLDDAVIAGLDAAFDALRTARQDEGRALGTLLDAHIDTVAGLVAQAGDCAAVRLDAIRDRMTAKFAELLAGDLPEERLAQEAAALAVKMDVREELDRLNAHVASARELLAGGSPVGRKLDFLSQEFNREANTLCSKSSDSSLTQIGLELKNTIDQFREQVQNVE